VEVIAEAYFGPVGGSAEPPPAIYTDTAAARVALEAQFESRTVTLAEPLGVPLSAADARFYSDDDFVDDES
jgi:hypothetical protein